MIFPSLYHYYKVGVHLKMTIVLRVVSIPFSFPLLVYNPRITPFKGDIFSLLKGARSVSFEPCLF